MSSAPAVGAVPYSPEPHLTLPDKWDGVTSKREVFITSLTLIFELQPYRYINHLAGLSSLRESHHSYGALRDIGNVIWSLQRSCAFQNFINDVLRDMLGR